MSLQTCPERQLATASVVQDQLTACDRLPTALIALRHLGVILEISCAQTRRGSRATAAPVTRLSTSISDHSPPGPRYGRSPDATEIPAPVSTTMLLYAAQSIPTIRRTYLSSASSTHPRQAAHS